MIALYIIVGMLGGASLIGLVLVVVVFFRELRALRTSLDQTTAVLRALSKDNTLAESLKSFGEIVSTGQALMKKMDTLAHVVKLFYDVAIQSKTVIEKAATQAPAEGDSAVYPYDEEQAAQREMQRKVRQPGVQVQPAEVEIDSGKAVKAGDV